MVSFKSNLITRFSFAPRSFRAFTHCVLIFFITGRCEICLFQFTEEYSDAAVQRHQDQHDNNGRFPCREEGCSEVPGLRKNLTRHLKLQHHIYDCSLVTCGRTFSTNAYLDEHIKTHSPFLCPYTGCGKCFTTTIIRTNHLKTHTATSKITASQDNSSTLPSTTRRRKRNIADDNDAADAITKMPRKARGKITMSNTFPSIIPSQVQNEDNDTSASFSSLLPSVSIIFPFWLLVIVSNEASHDITVEA